MSAAAVLATFAVGVLVGYVVPKLFAQPPELGKLDLGDALNAVVTAMLALLLTVVFQRRSDKNQGEKRLLSDQAEALGTALTDCREVFVTAYSQTTTWPNLELDAKILSALRVVSTQLTTLEEAAKLCSVDDQPKSLTNLREHVRVLRRALTDRSKTPNPYSAVEIDRAEVSFSEMSRLLLMFKIHLNKQ